MPFAQLDQLLRDPFPLVLSVLSLSHLLLARCLLEFLRDPFGPSIHLDLSLLFRLSFLRVPYDRLGQWVRWALSRLSAPSFRWDPCVLSDLLRQLSRADPSPRLLLSDLLHPEHRSPLQLGQSIQLSRWDRLFRLLQQLLRLLSVPSQTGLDSAPLHRLVHRVLSVPFVRMDPRLRLSMPIRLHLPVLSNLSLQLVLRAQTLPCCLPFQQCLVVHFHPLHLWAP